MKNEDELKAALAAAQAKNNALEAAILANPDLMSAARKLLAVAKVAAPIVAGAVGGPGAATIAKLAVGLAESVVEG